MLAGTTPITQNPLTDLLLQASPAAIVITDALGFISLTNHLAESWFGYTKSELLGQSVEMLVAWEQHSDHAAHRPCRMTQLGNRSLANKRPAQGRRKDGSRFSVQLTLHKLDGDAGATILAYVMMACPTEMMAPTRQILQSSERIRAERLAAVYQMVTGLAHENQNALQRAQACLDLLELDLSSHAELLYLTERIRTALLDLQRNYEEVKSYASPLVLRRAPTDLLQLCQLAYDEITDGALDGRLRFCGTAPCGQTRADIDPERTKQVLTSILDNAMAASAPQSPIEVHCQASRLGDRAAVELTIRDHGHGLNEDSAEHMFEPFATTKQRGTGLGLALSRRIIEAQQGIINAANHPQGGTVVRIVLPAAAAAANAPP